MKINHIAIWTKRLERMRAFYETYFQARAGEKYANPQTGFESYFLEFSSGARLEIMHMPDVLESIHEIDARYVGYVHIAVSVGSEEKVDALTDRLERDGYSIQSRPRRTGDGYYESVVLDPENNQVEITI
jgi:lactoylglutathione lyase